MKTLEEQINEEIAFAVERIMRASKSAAIAALELNFTQLGHAQLELPTIPAKKTKPPQHKTRKKSSPPRSREEIAELGARFLALVRANPGQPMSDLAPQLGLNPVQLKAPVASLRAAKKIKTVGERKRTCYFPVSQRDAA